MAEKDTIEPEPDATQAASAPAPAQERQNDPVETAEAPSGRSRGWAPPKRDWPVRLLIVGLAIGGALLALYAWDLPPFEGTVQSTDNAFVRGQTTIISPQVNGYVTEVLVQDYQAVHQGDVLVRIDDRIYRQRLEQVRTVAVGRGGLEAGVENARAAQQLAEIDLSNTVIHAPREGTVSDVGVRVGQYVTAGSQLLFLVPRTVWVVANFKEAQTAHMGPGQAATVKVDALAGQTLRGRVVRIAPAAGNEFSVIKPDNATGNFVKVPQRISVRIEIDAGQPLLARLRPGMSVIARVDTAARAQP